MEEHCQCNAREFDPEAGLPAQPTPKHMKLTRLQTTTMAVKLAVAFPISVFAQKKEKLVLSLPDLVQFNNILLTAAKEASKEKNFELVVQDGQDSSSKQSSDLQNAIDQGADGIVIAPNDATAMVPARNDVVDANIPIVTVDRNVDGTKKPIPHIGVDNTAQGRGVSVMTTTGERRSVVGGRCSR